MIESAPIAESYRYKAVIARKAANDLAGHEQRAYLRSSADIYDYLAASMESPATARRMQRAFGDSFA